MSDLERKKELLQSILESLKELQKDDVLRKVRVGDLIMLDLDVTGLVEYLEE